ncbi:MAG: DUF169 domain-containing protein [Thermodesulfobacteriota bacterium]
MDPALKEKFISLWDRYFNGVELPITYYYTDEVGRAELVTAPKVWACVMGVLAKVRRGEPLCFDENSFGCTGGRRYFGFGGELREGFEYFLSYGRPGVTEGERYKKSPEIVRRLLADTPDFKAPARYLVFKRWDRLEAVDEPEGVAVFAQPDVLSGLFTLNGYDRAERLAVIAPFSAGCGSIVKYPYLEKDKAKPMGVLGMFDVSARPYVPANTLTFAAPMKRFVEMIGNMEESFLITDSWEKIRKRIKPV